MISSFSLHFPYSVRKEENGNTWTQALVEGASACALSQKDHVSTDTANKEAGLLLLLFFHFIFCCFHCVFTEINLESLREEL